MNTLRSFGLLGGFLLLTGGAIAHSSPPAGHSSGLTVHEWGTFLSMSGSDGVVLDSMYHEEHALPAFVRSLQPDQLQQETAFSKFETPVIYFYTDQAQPVDVDVRFPRGIWTHWFPDAQQINAVRNVRADSKAAPFLADGRIHWQAQIIPADASHAAPTLPRTPPDSLWNFARQVDAAYVRTQRTRESTEKTETGRSNNVERFLFYRGLGQASLPLEVSSAQGGTLRLEAKFAGALTHVFVLRVEHGQGAYRYLSSLSPGETLTDVLPAMTGAQPLSTFTPRVAADMAARLVESGLYPKEAQAMVNTWRSSYFQSEGVRVLYVLPQAWTEGFLPMQITPRPEKLVRILVGRTELLTPEREREVETALRNYGSSDGAIRSHALAVLQAQGRYIEPILRRFLRNSPDDRVRAQCRRLLLTDWVTGLRAPTAATVATADH